MTSNSVALCHVCGHEVSTTSGGRACHYCALQLAAKVISRRSKSGHRSGQNSVQSIEALLQSHDPTESFDYELISEIARGGMGVVYRARQRSLNRDAAVKFILAGQLASRESLERFQLEAQAAARLHHPGIVRVYEIGEYKGFHFFSMELIDGDSLAECLEDFLLDPHAAAADGREQQLRIASLIASATRALEFAHKHGVLHRDLKPSNILIDAEGSPHLTDFGLAKLTGSAETGLTLTHAVLGTPGYLAPEQAAGSTDVTIAADVYGMGATLYELLTDSPPFSGANAVEVIWKSIHEPPIPPRKQNPAIDRDLETIVMRCLEKRPEQRYPSAASLADELERFTRGEPILSRPISSWEHLWRWAKRNPIISVMTTALALVILIGTGIAFWQWARAEQANLKMAESLVRLQWDAIDDTIRGGHASTALAKVASLLRSNPQDWKAAMLGISLIEQNRFPIPLAPIIKHSDGAELTVARLSGDGRRILTGSFEGTARIWDASTSKEVTPELRHDGKVNSGEFSPDDRLVATCSADQTVRLWKVDSGEPAFEPIRCAEPVDLVHFSVDGRHLLVKTIKSIALYDVAQGHLEWGPIQHDGTVIAANFAKEGRVVFSAQAAEDQSVVQVWDAQTGQQQTRTNIGTFEQIDVSQDLSRAVTSTFKTCEIRDLASGEVVKQIDSRNGRIMQILLAPDAKRLSVIGLDHWARVYDVETGHPISPDLPHDYKVNGSRFLGRGEQIVTWSDDSLAQIWEVETGERFAEPFRHKNRVQFVDVKTVDGQERFLTMTSHLKSISAETKTGAAQLWRIRDKKKLANRRIIPTGLSGSDGGRISRDGKWIAISNPKQEIVIVDTSTGQPTCPSIPVEGGAWGLLCTPDSRFLIVTSVTGEVSIRSMPDGKLAREPAKFPTTFQPAEISHDGTTFVTGSTDGKVRLWSVATGQPIWESDHGSEINSVAVSPNGQFVASGGENRLTRIWEAQSGKLIRTLAGHENEVTAVRFAPDGQSLVSSSDDFTARIWDVHRGTPTHTLSHHGEVVDVVYSPDGTRVATASRDRTAMIWNASTGQPAYRGLRSDHAVRNVRFSPDGKRLLVLDFRGLRLWDVEQGFPLTAPLKQWMHGGTGFSSTTNGPQFGPHGDEVFLATDTNESLLWKLPVPPAGVPPWFSKFLESVAGQRFAAGADVPEIVVLSQFLELKSQILSSTETDFYTTWAKEWINEN